MGTGGMGTGGMGTGGMGTGGMGGAGNGGSGAGWPTHVLLDPTFGDNGMTLINAPAANSDIVRATGHQPDGKMLLAGTTGTVFAESGEGLLIRVNANGTLDTTFGSNGRVIASFGPMHTDFSGVHVDAQGRIIVAALVDQATYNGRRFLLARYQSNGTLDASFGNGGLLEPLPLLVWSLISAFAPDGSLYAYSATPDQGAQAKIVFKLLPNGTLDPTYGTAGIQSVTNVPFSGYDDAAVQSDGKFWLLSRTFGSNVGYIARFLPNGPRDTSFGGTGEVKSPIKTLQAMVPVGNDAVYVGGFENLSGSSDGIIARIGANGTLDATFGNAGITRLSNPDYLNTIYRLSIDSTGRPLPTGYLNSGAVAMRFLTTGQLDTTYGNAGFANLNFWQALFQEVFTDGSLVAVSRELQSLNPNWQTARVKSDGTTDLAYGVNGLFAYNSGAPADESTQLLIESDGKIVTFGASSANSVASAAGIMMTRQLQDGALDPTFGMGGVSRLTTVPPSVAGVGRSSTGNYYSLAALVFSHDVYGFTPNGGPLAGFGTNGAAKEQLPGSGWHNGGLLVDSQDRIVTTAAQSIFAPISCQVRLKRLMPNGQLDTSFDVDGFTTTDFLNRANCQARVVRELTDGKLLIGVSTRAFQGPAESMLLRFDSTGALDMTFGNAGIAAIPGAMTVDNVVVLADGTMIAAGYQAEPMSGLAKDMAVARMTPNGQSDTTFGAGAGFVALPTGMAAGTTTIGNGLFARGPGIVVNADGSMVLAGTKQVGLHMQMLIVRLLANGTLDTTYAMSGFGVLPELPGNFAAFTMGRQPSGKLVVGGYGFWPATGTDVAVVRLAL